MRLSDIIRHVKGIFETKRKNPVLLENDSNLESRLKFLRVAKSNTPIQISDDTINVQGSLTVNGTSVSTEPDDDTGVITALNSATANELVTVGATTTELDAEANLTFDGDTLKVINTADLKNQLWLEYDETKYFTINVLSLGNTTLASTHDLTLAAGGDCINLSDSSNVFGEINVSQSSHLKLIGTTNYDVSIVSQGTGDVNLTSTDDITISSSDTLHLNSGDGTFTMKHNGTEFSSPSSAYAGMILGYTCVGADVADDSYTLTLNYVCFDDSGGTPIRVIFNTPPSEYVEIEVELYFSAGSSNKKLLLSLSDNATYGSNTLAHANQFEKVVTTPARGNGGTVTQKWILQAATLEAIGSSNSIYIAAATDSTSGTPIIRWGGNASGEYTNLVMKATALPANIVEGS